MIKSKVVVFDGESVKLLVNPDINDLKGVVIENPDLSAVNGIPPHFWKLTETNQIFPMNGEEIKKKSKQIKKQITFENAKNLNAIYWNHVYLFASGFIFCLIVNFIKGKL